MRHAPTPGASPPETMDRLARRRGRAVSAFAGLVIAPYFLLMALFAFDKPVLGAVLRSGLTLWLVSGTAFIATACLLSLGYVAWANLVFDPAAARLARPTDPAPGTTHDA